MRALLEERVSIRNIFLILETVGEAKSQGANQTQMVSNWSVSACPSKSSTSCRTGGTFAAGAAVDQLGTKFAEHEIKSEGGATDIALPPELFSELLNGIQEKLNETAARRLLPPIATSSKRRRFLQTVLASKGIRNAVLAYEEIKSGTKPQIVGIV